LAGIYNSQFGVFVEFGLYLIDFFELAVKLDLPLKIDEKSEIKDYYYYLTDKES
jgi:hypothetical protein